MAQYAQIATDLPSEYTVAMFGQLLTCQLAVITSYCDLQFTDTFATTKVVQGEPLPKDCRQWSTIMLGEQNVWLKRKDGLVFQLAEKLGRDYRNVWHFQPVLIPFYD
jgi:hypothetical protein